MRVTRRGTPWRALAGACLALLLGAAGTAFAELPPELAGRPLVAIAVTEHVGATLSPEDLGTTAGAPVDRALLREAITRLLATQRYADVQIDAEPVQGGVRLVVAATHLDFAGAGATTLTLESAKAA